MLLSGALPCKDSNSAQPGISDKSLSVCYASNNCAHAVVDHEHTVLLTVKTARNITVLSGTYLLQLFARKALGWRWNVVFMSTVFAIGDKSRKVFTQKKLTKRWRQGGQKQVIKTWKLTSGRIMEMKFTSIKCADVKCTQVYNLRKIKKRLKRATRVVTDYTNTCHVETTCDGLTPLFVTSVLTECFIHYSDIVKTKIYPRTF